jgi:hypothetical protein
MGSEEHFQRCRAIADRASIAAGGTGVFDKGLQPGIEIPYVIEAQNIAQVSTAGSECGLRRVQNAYIIGSQHGAGLRGRCNHIFDIGYRVRESELETAARRRRK